MRTREYGSRVKLFYDGGGTIEPGDFMQSHGKRGIGSTYMVEKVTRSPTIRHRRYLTCLRWPADQIPDGACRHPIYWYPRKKLDATTLADIARRRA